MAFAMHSYDTKQDVNEKIWKLKLKM